MRINNSNSYTPSQKTGVSFAGNSKLGKIFEKVADECNIGNKGDLKRNTFLFITILFMVGTRFIKSRGEDEKREVLTRDVPGVVLAAYGAPMLNKSLAYWATKETGIPIIQFAKEKEHNIRNAKFVTQKQVKDWYSELTKLENPLITFSETIAKHGGNLKKVMTKLNLDSHLKALTGKDDASNQEIIDSLKKAKNEKNSAFEILEDKIKNISPDNKLFKTARNAQAAVKLSGILFIAAFLGVLLPRLNIVTTKNKYKNELENQNKPQKKQSLSSKKIDKSI